VTKFRTALLAATVLAALPMAAKAQPVSGLYVGAGAGVNFLQSFTMTESDESNRYSYGKASPRQPGFVGLGSIGWGFGNGLRAELEGNYRNSTVKFGAEGYGGGTMQTYGVMVNALYDFNGVAPWVVPYLGAGVGYAWRQMQNLHSSDDSVNSTKGNFAFQFIAGAAFPIMQVPGLSLTAEYRFFGMLNNTYSNAGYFENGESVKVNNNYHNSILLGVRYAFNAAPAAMAAAPAPVAPAGKSFLVFFDWDKSTLTDRARGIIREAAASAKATAHTKIEVNGYADTSGTPAYNKGLSMRRAQTVAAELVRNGVGKNEIAIKAFGDTVLLVPTGPGVREPQNRRVEIIIR